LENGEDRKSGVSIWMKTKYIVSYQKAFGFSVREEKEFKDLSDAQWFQRALRRSDYITTLLEVKE